MSTTLSRSTFTALLAAERRLPRFASRVRVTPADPLASAESSVHRAGLLAMLRGVLSSDMAVASPNLAQEIQRGLGRRD